MSNICIKEVPEGGEREKGAESIFKEITKEITKNFPNLGRGMDIKLHETHKISKQIQTKEDFTKTHYNEIVKNQRQRENFESSKRKETHHIQGNPQ